MAKTDLLLNAIFLKNRIAELGIKQWWLAEQVGVDRKTVVRWLQGQVKAIQPENAEKLSQILNCQIDNLILKDLSHQLASAQDQKQAATALASSSLVEKLGPIGEWNVIESLLKATLVPDLPLQILGELYDQLTIASWRQSKMDQAAVYNQKTLEIARQLGDQALLASGLLSQANLNSWSGKTTEAVRLFQECLSLGEYLEPRVKGAILSNLGGVLVEAGDVVGGETQIRKSIECFQIEGRPINLSIAHTHLVLIHLDKGELEAAEQELKIVNHYARLDDYRRGVAFGLLLAGEIHARKGEKALAVGCNDEGLVAFAKLNISEGLNFEISGRTYRFLNDYPKAKALLEHGIKLAKDYPVYHAALLVELATVQKLLQEETWKKTADEAIRLYHQCDSPLRVKLVQKRLEIQ